MASALNLRHLLCGAPRWRTLPALYNSSRGSHIWYPDAEFERQFKLLSVTQTIAEAADRWSIGAIMFELVCGQKLAHLCPHGLATAITLPIPDCVDISFAARDLLSRLLLVNPLERLSDDDLRAHPFFNDCDWRVYDGTMPAVKAAFQSSNSHIEQVSEAFGVAQGAAEEQQLSCCDYDVPVSVSEPLSPQQLMMIANEKIVSSWRECCLFSA